MPSCVLNSIRVFSFFGPKLFSSISRTVKRKLSAVPMPFYEHYASIFVFRSNTFFCNISISGSRTVEREVLKVPKLSPEQYEHFRFWSKTFFFDISNRSMSCMRAFLFFVLINFSAISISRSRTVEREVLKVPTLSPEQYEHFRFWSKTFFFDISNHSMSSMRAF